MSIYSPSIIQVLVLVALSLFLVGSGTILNWIPVGWNTLTGNERAGDPITKSSMISTIVLPEFPFGWSLILF